MLTRRQALLPFALAPLAPAAAKRSNIVVILVDDLRWDALGYAGHPFAKTPNIDRLASTGAPLNNAFVTTPLCSPSRASFLTRYYVHKHGVIDNTEHNELSHKLVTFPRLLHDTGYDTAYVDKWHMSNDDSPRPSFSRWVGSRLQGVYENPEFNIDGKPEPQQGYMTDLLNQQAVSFVRQSRGEKPFCLFRAHKAVHGPFTPAACHAAEYATDEIPRAISAQHRPVDKPALLRPLPAVATATRKAGAAKQKAGPAVPNDELVRNQLRCLRSTDDGVGQLLTALRQTGQESNTVVIFTSDKGYFWGEHGLGDKRWAYEDSLRIPLVISRPGSIDPGLHIGALVLNIDIAPTALALSGLKPPKTMLGRSLLPLFGRNESKWRTAFLAEYFHEPNFPRTPKWEAIRTPEWKYIHYPELPDMDELSHLRADQFEQRNLAPDPARAKVLQELRAELAAQPKATS